MFRSGRGYLLLNSLKTRKALTANTIEAANDGPEIPRPDGDSDAQLITQKAAEHHEGAAKSHRAAADHHGKNDHTKGCEHATEAHKHSKVASAASEEAHAKSSSKK
jgi:hypothetical protein